MSTIAENRRAQHDYHIEDTYAAGLKLEGWEVKALLAGRGNFGMGGSFVAMRNGEAFLEGVQITPLPYAMRNEIDKCEPFRSRKLLLNRSELDKISRLTTRRGYTVIPLRVFKAEKHGKLKLAIALAKGKKQYDKRADEKARDLERIRD